MSGVRRLLKPKVPNRFGRENPIIRMSWNPQNLQNLLSFIELPDLSRMTVYQQKWAAKKFLRGYHVPNITETQFLDRHFSTALPVKMHSADEKLKLPPIQSIVFGELERRLDVIVFRSCFASSIWNARQVVVHGHVKVNGEVCRYPARRLDDGDMITISPSSIPTLSTRPVAVKKKKSSETEEAKDAKSGVEAADAKSAEETVETAASVSENANATNDESKEMISQQRDASKPLYWKPIPYMSPWIFIPSYLEVDFATTSAILLRSPLVQPERMEIPSPFPPSWHQLVYEWYAKKKRASRKVPLKPVLVVNGQTVKLKPKFDRMVRQDQANL